MTNDEKFNNEKLQESMNNLQLAFKCAGMSFKSLQEQLREYDRLIAEENLKSRLIEIAPPNGINWAEFRRRIYQPIMPNNWLKRNKIPMRRGRRKNDK